MKRRPDYTQRWCLIVPVALMLLAFSSVVAADPPHKQGPGSLAECDEWPHGWESDICQRYVDLAVDLTELTLAEED